MHEWAGPQAIKTHTAALAVDGRPWSHATAMAAYRATAARISAAWAEMDVFDKPSLQRTDIRAADQAIQAAFRAHNTGAVAGALARWEQAITGARP